MVLVSYGNLKYSVEKVSSVNYYITCLTIALTPYQ